jgi:hypothetical protein
MAMSSLFRILAATPWWAFALLGLLIWLGLQAAKTRVVALRRIFVIPAVFIVWGIVGLALRPSFSGILAADWTVTAICGGALAVMTTRIDGLVADRRHGLVHLPGSLLLLARVLTIFVVKYGLGVAAAMRSDLREQLMLWDIAVSGASAGYFLGWAITFWRVLQHAPEADLVATARPAGAMPVALVGQDQAGLP